MKLVVLLFTIFSANVFAQSNTISTNSIKKLPISSKLSLTSDSLRDRSDKNKLNGLINFAEANITYKVNSKLRLRIRNTWTGAFQSEQENKFSYADTQFHIRTKALNIRDHGITLNPELRTIYQTDARARLKYGTYGDIQARAYFGLPVLGKLVINKYTSYIRVQKHLVKDNDQEARSWSFRLRVTPTYKLLSNLDISLRTTFNQHIINNDSGVSSKDIRIQPNARYQYKKLAISLGIEGKPWKSDSDGQLTAQSQFMDNIVYSSNITYSLF